jgi:tetratricopeptide (TPR) repeat protein
MTSGSLIDKMVVAAQSKIDEAEQSCGEVHERVIKELAYLADLYLALGKIDLAKPIYSRILDLQHRLLGPMDPACADTWMALGELYEDESELDKAEHFYLAAQWILDHSVNSRSDVRGRISLKLYGIYKVTGNKRKITEMESRLYPYLNSRLPASEPVSKPANRRVLSMDCTVVAPGCAAVA